MSLKDRLQSDLQDAMRQGDARRKAALRLTLSNLRVVEVAKTRHELDDAAVMAVLQQEVKRRRETVSELEKLPERAAQLAEEREELAVLESYLPRQMTRDEIAEHVRAVVAEMGGTPLVGDVMKRAMPALKGLADGRVVQEVVREILSGSG
jgi:uncharacterized protein YqeY